jgi:hypothetical protein
MTIRATYMKAEALFFAATLAIASSPALSQADGTNIKLLSDCVRAADEKYKMTWATLCSQGGKAGYCADFIGSPKDVQFSQLRNEEKALCAGKVYWPP